MAKAMYYHEIEPGEACDKCGKPLIVVAVDGEVLFVCLRCTPRRIVSRVPCKK